MPINEKQHYERTQKMIPKCTCGQFNDPCIDCIEEKQRKFFDTLFEFMELDLCRMDIETDVDVDAIRYHIATLEHDIASYMLEWGYLSQELFDKILTGIDDIKRNKIKTRKYSKRG